MRRHTTARMPTATPFVRALARATHRARARSMASSSSSSSRASSASSARAASDTATTRGRVAVVGGGASGAACAREIARRSTREVCVFDAGRALGGRASTREEARGRWDHGAAFAAASDGDDDDDDERAWRSWIEEKTRCGEMVRWRGPFATVRASDGDARVVEASDARFAWSPSFDDVERRALERAGVDVRTSARVVGFARDDANGTVSVRYEAFGEGERTESGFECVVLADKNVATRRGERGDAVLDSLDVDDIASAMRGVSSTPSLSLMVTLNRAPAVDFVGAEIVADDTLGWMANESSKPGRETRDVCWVAHATEAYATSKVTEQSLKTRPGTPEHAAWMHDVERDMRDALLRVLRAVESPSASSDQPLEIVSARAHRWGAAFPTSSATTDGAKFLRASRPGVAVYAVGDYCGGDAPDARRRGLRAAVLSGLAAAADVCAAAADGRIQSKL